MPNDVYAARRAQWLAELSGALGEARRLVRELDGEARFEAMELCAQIDDLRRRVDAMRLKRDGGHDPDLDRDWMKVPWQVIDPPDIARRSQPAVGATWVAR